MRYTASLQACHRSNPLRAKSDSSQVGVSYAAADASGNLQGERYLSCRGASAVSRRAMAGWATGRSWRAPSDGHCRSQFLQTRKDMGGPQAAITTPSSPRLRTQRVSIGIALAQSTRAGCCEHPARLSTPLTWGEKSLTDVSVSRPLWLFDHSNFVTRRARTQQRLVGYSREGVVLRPAQGASTSTSLLHHASGARPRN